MVRLIEVVTTGRYEGPKADDADGSVYLVFEYVPYDMTGLIGSPKE